MLAHQGGCSESLERIDSGLDALLSDLDSSLQTSRATTAAMKTAVDVADLVCYLLKFIVFVVGRFYVHHVNVGVDGYYSCNCFPLCRSSMISLFDDGKPTFFISSMYKCNL